MTEKTQKHTRTKTQENTRKNSAMWAMTTNVAICMLLQHSFNMILRLKQYLVDIIAQSTHPQYFTFFPVIRYVGNDYICSHSEKQSCYELYQVSMDHFEFIIALV